jgi:hypothetical protein
MQTPAAMSLGQDVDPTRRLEGDGGEMEEARIHALTSKRSQKRIGDPRLGETLGTQSAGIARPTGPTVGAGIIATAGQPIVDPERQPGADDFGLAHLDQWGMDTITLTSLDTGGRGQIGQRLEGGDVLGPAVRIAGIVERIDPDEDVARLQHLGPGERERQKNRIARRHIGHRDILLHRASDRAPWERRDPPSAPSRRSGADRSRRSHARPRPGIRRHARPLPARRHDADHSGKTAHEARNPGRGRWRAPWSNPGRRSTGRQPVSSPDLAPRSTRALGVDRRIGRHFSHPSISGIGMMQEHRIKLWDLPTRLFHWLLVLLVTLAFVTGLTGGPWIDWHGRIGLAIFGLIVFRLVWGFVGSTYARFGQFVSGPRPSSPICADAGTAWGTIHWGASRCWCCWH